MVTSLPAVSGTALPDDSAPVTILAAAQPSSTGRAGSDVHPVSDPSYTATPRPPTRWAGSLVDDMVLERAAMVAGLVTSRVRGGAPPRRPDGAVVEVVVDPQEHVGAGGGRPRAGPGPR